MRPRAITVILNETSGVGARGRFEALAEACRQFELDASIVRAAGHELLDATEHCARTARVLVAAGGDGTVSTVASVAVRSGATFGVVPLGTRNHFARDAGIPLDLAEAVAVIATGQALHFDVGEVNGRTFVNNVSLGLYPRLVWEREIEKARGRSRSAAVAIALARTWRRYRTMTVRMAVDGVPLVRSTPFVFVGNGEYRAEGMELGSRPSLDAGRLSIFLAPELDRFEALALPFRALIRRLPTNGKFESFSASEVVVERTHRQVSIAVDGELMLATPPLHFSIRRRVLPTITTVPA